VTPYYEDESVTLYHGDCREVTAWLEADVLVTDPPYGRDWKQGNIKGHRGSDARAGIANDHSTEVRDDALALWAGRPAIVFGDLMLAPPAVTKLVGVYHKASGADGMRGAIAGVRRDAEAIYFLGGWPSGLGGRSSVFVTTRCISAVHGLVNQSGGHPHTKAPSVMNELIGLTQGIVADPFAGGGSTLVAAKQLGRKAIGVELEERYCEIAAKRLAQGVLDFGEASA
jgi:site-specific DNA-methyltransferase (adenine-specific)